MNAIIRLIKPENMELEVTAEKRPLLLLCMPRDDQFSHQLKVLEDIAVENTQTVKAGVLQEELIEVFKKTYGFTGTPTFLILVEGREKGRLLGLANRLTLKDFISCWIERDPARS
jgi:hypothetical protein